MLRRSVERGVRRYQEYFRSATGNVEVEMKIPWEAERRNRCRDCRMVELGFASTPRMMVLLGW